MIAGEGRVCARLGRQVRRGRRNRLDTWLLVLCRVPDYAELLVDSGGSRCVEPALLGIILTRPKASPLPWEAFMNNSAGCSRSEQRTLRDPSLLYISRLLSDCCARRVTRRRRYASKCGSCVTSAYG